jgi:2-keto-4-pentenoate hydratase
MTYQDPHMLATLQRKGKTIKAIIRQMAHDEQLVVGKKYRFSSGPMWMVLSVEQPSKSYFAL